MQQIKIAVQELQVAETLFNHYRKDVAAVGGLGSSLTTEGRLLALDQNYAGLWQKLDEVRLLAVEIGRDTSQYDSLREQVADVFEGYKEKRELKLSLDGVAEKVTVSISRKRVLAARDALVALKAAVPEAAIANTRDEADPDVARFMAGERGGQMAVRWLLRAGAIVLAVGSIVTVVYLLRPPDYGHKFNRKIRVIEQTLRGSPCDKKAIVKLAETLNQAKAHQVAIERAREFIGRCGEHRRLRWAIFTAHKRLAHYRKALSEVNRLIAAVPHDWDYRWWRGQVHAQLGDTESAIIDYRQAVALQPALRSVPFNLANALERVKRPCEALFWLRNYLHHHPEALRHPHVKRHIGRLEALPACSALVGTGQAELAITEPIKVEVAGSSGKAVESSLKVLPGWRDRLFTIVSAALAKRAGVQAITGKLMLRYSGGLIDVRLARADLRVGEALAKQVWVAIAKQPPPDGAADGLLGRSFLERFAVSRDEAGSALRLAPIPATP